MKKRRRSKYKSTKVPASTVALYIGAAVLILGICAVVFFIGFNIMNNNSASSSSSPQISSQSSTGGFILPPDVQSGSSVAQSSQSSSSPETQSSMSQSSSSETQSSTPTPSSSSSQGNTLPTSFDKEFFKNDLFIGDSIFTGLYLYNHIDQNNVAAKVGYTPNGVINSAFDARGLSAADYAVQLSPKHIYILIGSNGLSSSGLSALKNSYSEMIKALKEKVPDSEICCISLTPVARETDYPNIHNSDVREMNDFIKQQCAEQGCDFYNFYSDVTDSEGYFLKQYAEVDGLHFKSNTYKVLLSALQKKYS